MMMTMIVGDEDPLVPPKHTHCINASHFSGLAVEDGGATRPSPVHDGGDATLAQAAQGDPVIGSRDRE